MAAGHARPDRAAPGGQRGGRGGDGGRGRSAVPTAVATRRHRRTRLALADGGARARRRADRGQRRLQRQPRVDARGTGGPGRHRARRGRRTVAVLGEMLELGDGAEESHREVGRAAAAAGVDVVVVVGERARGIAVGLGEAEWDGTVVPAAGRDEAMEWVRKNVAAEDVVLVKASRGVALEVVADELLEGRHRGTMRAILLGGGLALLVSLLGTRVAIRRFTQLGYGQEIRDDGPTSHHTKRGTPTMGGVVIIAATLIGYFGAKLITDDRAVGVRVAPALPVRRHGPGRLPRRLHQDLQAAQPRPAQQGQDDRADRGRGGVRHPRAVADAGGRQRPHSRLGEDLVPPGDRVARPARGSRGRAHLADRDRHQQRGEPRRRARRAGHRRVRDGLRRLHAGEHLAEQPVLPGTPRAPPATTSETRSTSR